MKKIFSIWCVLFVISASSCLGQSLDDSSRVNRNRISVLAGLPRLAGLQIEHVLPIANNHLSLTGDVSLLPNIFPESQTFTSYLGLGVNGYFNKNGSGPYIGLGYGSLYIRADEIDNDPVDLDVRFNWLSGHAGVKAGKKLFFRFELGYSMIFYDIDKANQFLNETYGIEIKPTISFLHLPNTSIGIGYSF